MSSYQGSAVFRFRAGDEDFSLHSQDCSTHVKEPSKGGIGGVENDLGRWTAIGVFRVHDDEDAEVRRAFFALPTATAALAVSGDLVLTAERGATLQGRVVLKRFEGKGRGALLLTFGGVGLPIVGPAGGKT